MSEYSFLPSSPKSSGPGSKSKVSSASRSRSASASKPVPPLIFIGGSAFVVAEALPLFRRLRDLSRAPDRLIYGAELQGRIIGYLNDVRLENNGLEVGYVMSPAHWNRGYCTEMLAAVRDALFRLGFAALRAGYFEGNHASRRVMEKCGLRPTGETETIAYRGKDRKVICMALLRE